MLSKVKTAYWYLGQPKGMFLTYDLILQKTIYQKNEKTGKQSQKWCESLAVTTSEAIQQLFGIAKDEIIRIEKEFSEEFRNANRLIAECPVKLGGAGNLDLLYNISEKIQANRVLETGVAYGWSSLAILLSISKRKNARLISTDMPYAKMNSEKFVGLVVPERFKNSWTIIREADISAIPKALKLSDTFDMIHYDSDKSYLGRKRAYPILFKALKKGGVFISDDIQDNLAFKFFCDYLKLQPVVITYEDKFIGVIRK